MAPIRVIYCSWSAFKKEEWEVAQSTIRLDDPDGEMLGELFNIEFRDVATSEPLLCDLEGMVRSKAESAYRAVKVPCIVEHAGLILEGYEKNSFPGGLTQPMWDALGAERFVASCAALTNKAIARAVIGYCDGMRVYTFVGETRGTLSPTPKGRREFYWDTIFCPEEYAGITYAEIVGDDRSGLLKKLQISQSIAALKKFMRHRLANEPELFPAL